MKERKKVSHTLPRPFSRVIGQVEDLVSFTGERQILIMLNLDGPTVKLTYEGGELVEMSTWNDDGQGEEVTHNARAISGIPAKIVCKERLVVLGKVFIRPSDFEELKDTLKDRDGHPCTSGRAFAADSVRLLESAACWERRLVFMPFHVLEGFAVLETKAKRLQELGRFGFCGSSSLASRGVLSRADLDGALEKLPQYAQKQDLPLDGILFAYNDVVVSRTQGEGKDTLVFKPGTERSPLSPFAQCLTAAGIPMLTNDSVQALDQHFQGNLDGFENAVMSGYEFGQVPGVDKDLTREIGQWFQSEENWCRWMELREQAECGGEQP